MYLFAYRTHNEETYTSYNNLRGIVLCDHSILKKGPFDNVITEMVDAYKNGTRDYEYDFNHEVGGLVLRFVGDWRYSYGEFWRYLMNGRMNQNTNKHLLHMFGLWSNILS